MQYQNYKSPMKKLIRFFQISRDNWKEKYLILKKDIKRFKNRIYDLEKRKESWKQEALNGREKIKSLQLEIQGFENIEPIKKKTKSKPVKPHNYNFNLKPISNFISFVVNCSSSMRCAVKSLHVVNKSQKLPSVSTGRMWLMKLGYYELMRIKEIAEDWIWIMDHTIQIGSQKCLVILGIRAKNLPKNRALKYEDTSLIDLVPVTKSNGEIVYQQMEKKVKEIGVPMAIVADKGSDIKSGIDKFCNVHEKCQYIYDLKHKIAILLKNILEKDKQWSELKTEIALIANKMQQTSLAKYKPPKQRAKARYMNIEKQIRWAKDSLIIKKNIENQESKSDDEKKLLAVLGTLDKFEENIKEYSEIVEVISFAHQFMNHYNLREDSYQKMIKSQIQSQKNGSFIIKNDKAKELNNQILDFVEKQQTICKKEEILPHSSEIIESVFGKFKYMENEQAHSNFTGYILSIGAIVSKKTDEIIKTALEITTNKQIYEWCDKHIGENIKVEKKKIYEKVETKVEYYFCE